MEESYFSLCNSTATAAVILLPLTIFFFIVITKSEGAGGNLPPGPKKYPIIGNLHLVSEPPFRSFRELAKQYGPIMHLKLGGVNSVVVSSPEIAKEILKDNDPIFTDKLQSMAMKILWYDYIDIGFCPYGEYWRQMRKICIVEVLSAKSVRSFSSIREDEVFSMIESIHLSEGNPVNLSEKLTSLLSSITCRAAFGKVCKDKASLTRLVTQGIALGAGLSIADIFPASYIAKALSWGTKRKLMKMRRELDVILNDIIREHEVNRASGKAGNGEFGNEDLVDVLLRVKEGGELEFPIGYDNIKAILFDMFGGGTATSSSTIDWAMTELLRHPQVMSKVQAEIRQMVMEKDNSKIEEADIQKLKYLKFVIMETHRLHPQGSLIPRVSREECKVSGYTIPKRVKVFINTWAIHRDPKNWEDPERFWPERFADHPSLEFTGSDFRYLPFGSGKRICPGIAFASASVALPLAHLLYSFNWKLPAGVNAQDMNMIETSSLSTARKDNLFVLATPYQPSSL